MDINNVPIGGIISFGSYGVRNTEPEQILWVKASIYNDFISLHVLDDIIFDAPEMHASGRILNDSYELSNIRMFLNSKSEVWWSPSYEFDKPPSQSLIGGYDQKNGFLCCFSDDEILHIDMTEEPVRIPNRKDIMGEDAFPLFKKSKIGIRAHPTMNLVKNCRIQNEYKRGTSSFAAFWCLKEVTEDNISNGQQHSINRQGYVEPVYVSRKCGLRPVLRLTKETQVCLERDNGIYHILESEKIQDKAFDEDDVKNILGIKIF